MSEGTDMKGVHVVDESVQPLAEEGWAKLDLVLEMTLAQNDFGDRADRLV